MKWIIGTRGSQLALRQSEEIKKQMISLGADIDVKIIKTQGDKIQNVGFDKMEGKGFFTKELEEALLDKRVDLAVHSLKDLPTEFPPELKIAAYCSPEDSSETVIMHAETYDRYRPLKLKPNSCIGTSSIRREAQIRYFRPDLEIKPLRGNLNTRLQKLIDGQYDAIMLAKAGLDRLNMDTGDLVVAALDKTEFLPAPGQGILALEIRSDDESLQKFLANINNDDAEIIARLERGLLARFHGGCRLPLAVNAHPIKTGYAMKAFLGMPNNGGWNLPALFEGTHSNIEVLVDMAFKELTEIVPEDSEEKALKVLVTRSPEDASEFFKGRLNKLEPVYYPVFQIKPKFDKTLIRQVLAKIERYAWIIFTSKNGVNIFLDILADRGVEIPETTRIAAVGQRTAKLLKNRDIDVSFAPSRESANGLIEELMPTLKKNNRVLIPQGEAAPQTLADGFTKHGLKAERLNLYQTIPTPREDLPEININEIGAIIFTSPLAVQYFNDLGHEIPENVWLAVLGQPTAQKLSEIYRHPDYIPGKADMHDITDKILEMK